MTIFDTAAVLLALSALFGWLNHRFFRLPHTIGLVIIAFAASLGVIAIDLAWPGVGIGDTVRGLLEGIDFHATLMHGMLSVMLFAGALHVDLSQLADRKWAITALASVGVLLSTFIVAGLLWLAAAALGLELPFIWALVFGALISPTDPVAVLGILKTVEVPESLEAKIAGESLFNDGIGVVVFTIIVAIAVGGGPDGPIGPLDVAELFLVEAVGGAVLGIAAGYATYRALHAIDDYALEVLITLALVVGGYALAIALHLSGPIAVVVAGLFIGNRGVRYAMSGTTRDYVLKFWTLADEILNSVLFLLIGLEVIVVASVASTASGAASGAAPWIAGALAIPIVLAARLISVGLPMKLLSVRRAYTEGAVPVLVWGGLRGGIAVALALSLPAVPVKPLILDVTYCVVLFSIVVQGLTIKPVIGRFVSED